LFINYLFVIYNIQVLGIIGIQHGKLSKIYGNHRNKVIKIKVKKEGKKHRVEITTSLFTQINGWEMSMYTYIDKNHMTLFLKTIYN